MSTNKSKAKEIGAASGSVAIAALSTAWSGAYNSRLKADAITANNRARIEQLRDQFALDSQNFANNLNAIDEQRTRNDVLIQENKLEAQDRLAGALVGSGIKGRSVDALEAQVAGDVAKAHLENKRQSVQQKDSLFLGLKRTGQQIRDEIKYLDTFDFGAEKAANDMATLMATVQSSADAAAKIAGGM